MVYTAVGASAQTWKDVRAVRAPWLRRFRNRILVLVAAASLVPAALLLGNSLFLDGLVHQQMHREVDEALSLAINPDRP